MPNFYDAVNFLATSSGTGDFVVASAVQGYRTPLAAAVPNGATSGYYAASTSGNEWELGVTTYATGTVTAARTTVIDNHLGTTAKVNFTAAPNVAFVELSRDMLGFDFANSFTAAQKTQALTNLGAAPAITSLTASLGADVTLNNTATYFSGPAVAQGTAGTWLVIAQVTCTDTAAAAAFDGKLWDGTTVIASGRTSNVAANYGVVLTLSGIITSPAGNLRMDVKGASNTTGRIKFNLTGNSKDSTITAIRIA